MNTLTFILTKPVPLASAHHLINVLPVRVAAGFPSPAEDHAVQRIDLIAQLISTLRRPFYCACVANL